MERQKNGLHGWASRMQSPAERPLCRFFVFCIQLLSQPRIKNDGLCFDITDEIVVDVNIAFLVIVHAIAFADLNFLNQPHQRGTV